jgi:hypothetical protein
MKMKAKYMNVIKNKGLSMVLLLCLIGLLNVIAFELLCIIKEHSVIKEYYLLALVVLVLILTNVIFYYWKKRSQRIIVDLANISMIYRRLLRIIPIAVIFLALFLIPLENFVFTINIITALIIIPLFTSKYFVIDAKGIRYVFRWDLKWEHIKSYDLNKETGTLKIQSKFANDDKQIVGISEKYHSVILTNMDIHLNSIKL